MNIKITNENIAGVNFCTLDLPKTIELLAEWSGLKAKDLKAKGENLKVEGEGTNLKAEDLKAEGGGARGMERGAEVRQQRAESGGQRAAKTTQPLELTTRTNNSTTQPLNDFTTQPTPLSAIEPKARPRWFACVNPHSVESARRDTEFKAAVESADLVTADGTGIVVGSMLLGGNVRDRVCGPDIFPQLCAFLNERKAGTRMFFLGTNDATLAALEKRFGEVYPHLVHAGGFAPPYRQQFSDEENAEMVERINATNADMLWVGLGAPKQEKWCHQNAKKLNVNLIGPVGGVFDFFTGKVKLPPAWAQELGMIWLWRLIQQPRRLLRRNLDAPVFLWHVLKQRVKRGSASEKRKEES